MQKNGLKWRTQTVKDYDKYCANVIISGIDIIESTVLKDTIFTESSVLAPNFEANIVLFAAVGALAEITRETSNTPRIPQR